MSPIQNLPHNTFLQTANVICADRRGLGEVLKIDYDKILDPQSPYMCLLSFHEEIVCLDNLDFWKTCTTKHKHLPGRISWTILVCYFKMETMNLSRNPLGEKFVSVYYRGIEDILKDQFAKGSTVDFQAMFDMALWYFNTEQSGRKRVCMYSLLSLRIKFLYHLYGKMDISKLFVNRESCRMTTIC